MYVFQPRQSRIVVLNRVFISVILDKYHWMLYFLVPAMYPRFLITLDEELNPLPVTVRVGQVRLASFSFFDLSLTETSHRLSM